jgi:hypothetical protein
MLKLATRYQALERSGNARTYSDLLNSPAVDDHPENDPNQLIDFNYLAIFLGLHIDDAVSPRTSSPKVLSSDLLLTLCSRHNCFFWVDCFWRITLASPIYRGCLPS